MAVGFGASARLVAVVAVLTAPACRGPASPTDLPEEARAFLRDHRSALDLADNDDFASWSRLDAVAGEYDLILTGEAHGTTVSVPLKLKFLRYLNRREGVRVYLDEIGYGAARLVRDYLATGDETDLRFIMNALTGTDAHNADTLGFWRRLRQQEQREPPSRRILFLGVDVEHQRDIGVYALARLLPPASSGEPEAVARVRRLAAAFASHQFVSARYEPGLAAEIPAAVADLDAALRNDPGGFRSLLGANHADFVLTSVALRDALTYYGQADGPARQQFRERAMVRTFREIHDGLPADVPRRFYGHFGSRHVAQTTRDTANPTLATILQHEAGSPVRGRVLTVWPFYLDSFQLRSGQRREAIRDESAEPLRDLVLGDVTLFQLTGPGSPFASGDSLAPERTPGAATTDYFQFAVLLRGSEASAPYVAPAGLSREVDPSTAH
jgi:hypothetical protein